MTTRRPGWYVACPSYWRGPFKTAETARRELERIEQAGHCSEDHRVEEVRR